VNTSADKIVTILDFVYLRDRSLLGRYLLLSFYYFLPAIFSRRVVFISQFVQSEAQRFLLRFENKHRVIPFSGNKALLPFADTSFNVLEKHFASNSYIILGTAPNKNVYSQIEALNSAADDLGKFFTLYVIGELDEDISNSIRSRKWRNLDIINFDKLELEHLSKLYNKVHCVLFASFYEGFGAPIVEAGYFKVPIITSNVSPMCDVLKCPSLLCKPDDINDIKSAIIQLRNMTFTEYCKLCDIVAKNADLYSYSTIAKKYLML
jgi:glycosyltransferase involved in cell wall biosynthesis